MLRGLTPVKPFCQYPSICAELPAFEHSAQRIRRTSVVVVFHTAGTAVLHTPAAHGKQRQLGSIHKAAPAVATPEALLKEEGSPADVDTDSDVDLQLATEVLFALKRYNPTGLSDGPASLTQVRPYNAAEVQHALDHGSELLANFRASKLANIAAALAAAGHVDSAFSQHLGHTAAQQLKATPAADSHVAAIAELKTLCFLAVAFARMGQLHVELFEQIAVRGASLLSRHKILNPRKRSHGHHLALLAAAFAALKLHPPQLFRALGELLKQQRHVLWLLGPQESMLLLWAFAKVQHKDPPAQLLLAQRATTQVGQLDCQGLAHAYTQCASVGLTAPPLLSALRKATRQRLRGMQPQHLTAILVALAGLQQQDSLLLDELSGTLHNKMANMTAVQIGACFTACSMLRYSNPWLFEQASKMLVSHKLAKAAQLTATQLADILLACRQLQYHNNLLFAQLGTVAAGGLCMSWTAAELEAVLLGYYAVGFYQPELLLAAAKRLLQLVENHEELQQQVQRHDQEDAEHLVSAASWLAQMPAAGGSAVERGFARTAVSAVAAAVLQDQQHTQRCSLSYFVKLGVALVLSTAADGTAKWQQQQGQHAEVVEAVLLHIAEELTTIQAAPELAAVGPTLLQLMQLLWLSEVQLANSTQQQQSQGQQPLWQLCLQQELLAQYLQLNQAQPVAKQQPASPLIRAILPLVQQHVQGTAGVQVLSPYVLPESPVAVPAAVVFSGTAAVDVPLDSTPDLADRSGSQLQQQEQQGLVLGEVHRGPRRLTLPADVVQLLQRCKAAGRPVAIFDSSQPPCPQLGAASCASGWFTSSEPRLLLPLSALWQDGLVKAGWSVVVLAEAPDQRVD